MGRRDHLGLRAELSRLTNDTFDGLCHRTTRLGVAALRPQAARRRLTPS